MIVYVQQNLDATMNNNRESKTEFGEMIYKRRTARTGKREREGKTIKICGGIWRKYE